MRVTQALVSLQLLAFVLAASATPLVAERQASNATDADDGSASAPSSSDG
ncbi:hypothetical protein OF83DRAFT_1166990 [Amylostereum chailletii]|nr:hypothetical protein OF83DRAFT_1166990 [Amylostereum chailletii]